MGGPNSLTKVPRYVPHQAEIERGLRRCPFGATGLNNLPFIFRHGQSGHIPDWKVAVDP